MSADEGERQRRRFDDAHSIEIRIWNLEKQDADKETRIRDLYTQLGEQRVMMESITTSVENVQSSVSKIDTRTEVIEKTAIQNQIITLSGSNRNLAAIIVACIAIIGTILTTLHH